ncbi:mismatch repair endonuclease PMS2 isoform X1 [Amyelois transitella]|uniref:mismatch repair endonuclease PMS2 isoform X1 n=1 Tax=Amyelois transitella TaxID=680683 RepID=UPI00067C24A8|nr:mismatch repair endonuclease PMS2 isoform X1 [Amyelois transitella]
MDGNNQNNWDVHSIKRINTDTVHKICSGQVVLSLAVAVKELVENSLDAKATNIDIRLKNYGTELIEVSDNGSGVTEDNFAALTLKYHTSKLSDYSDLLGVASFGFRGEALSSLCELSNLTITTRHQSSSYATKIEYDNKGNIVKKTPCSRQIGTTVSLTNLFSSLPVRKKEFHKNAKREFNKMTQLLYAYCLISLGVKITCSNQTNSNPKSLVVATQGSTSYKDNIACVFGIKQLQSILELKPEQVTNIKDNIFRGLSGEVEKSEESVHIEDVEIDLSEDSNEADEIKNSQESVSSSQKSLGYKNVVNPVEFTGFISSCAHGSGRSSTDRQFYYVNSRPCEPTKVVKLINEVYRQYNPNQYPFVFLNIKMDRTTVDVNVTPDKRKVFLIKEKLVLDTLKNSILKLYESIPRTLKVNQSSTLYTEGDRPSDVKSEVDQPRIFQSFLQTFSNKSRSVSDIPKNESIEKKVELKRKSTSMLQYVSSKTIKRDDYHSSKTINEEVKAGSTDEYEPKPLCNVAVWNNNDESKIQLNKNDLLKSENIIYDKSNIIYLENADTLPDTQIRKVSDVIIEKEHSISCRTTNLPTKPNITKVLILEKSPNKLEKKVITDKEYLGKHSRKSVNLKISLEEVQNMTKIYNQRDQTSVPESVKFRTEINPVHNKKCEEELSREISKDSFRQMKVIGQFNLGFIITRLGEDLFIIDQHATDEIYNFETLQRTTELTNQKLVIPQQLELSGVNEQILMDNLDVFKKNGFTFEVNENALPTKRVKLLTIPMSKNWIFGKEDIEELLFMLRENPSEYSRPSRVRAMFASRACRKSVMIGTALSKSDMKILVDHMAEIDKPWNCPHGRPTIRHLVNLALVHLKDT